MKLNKKFEPINEGDFLDRFDFYKFWVILIFWRFLLYAFTLGLFASPIIMYRSDTPFFTVGGKLWEQNILFIPVILSFLFVIVRNIRWRKNGFPFFFKDRKYSKIDKYIMYISSVHGLIVGFFSKV